MRQILSAYLPAALVIGSFASSLAASAAPEPASGTWMTADGASKVKIAPCGTAHCATIVWVRPLPADADPAAALAKKNLLGTQISTDLRRSDEGSLAGSIINPESGKSYHVTVKVRNVNAIEMGGCVLGGLLCGSETWTRAPEEVAVVTPRPAGKASARAGTPAPRPAAAAPEPVAEPED